ncbi:MCE family protein [Mumia sp. zg.B53]|uniref:MCE family protein n=1 Tax=Mumia sp. zg.B53 TaxID=2855449 RepID=UPI001C6E5BE0|nr:MlaD family protein [Mumia sp. zg.B53]MBW9213948.1 MCE family protein [Mumia sp. zg.B53]
MITRRVRVQLVLFLVITLVGIAYVGATYARLDRLIGGSGYSVTVQMAESGGIFTGADVTYRGVSVGRVKEMWLTADGVDVEVRIDEDAPRIPADTAVVVANKSAVGEQYLDFQPEGAAGPFLGEDDVVARERTRVPVDTRTLITDVSGLLSSVDADDLSTVITELGAAFEGSGKDIRTTIDATSSFITKADQKYAMTADLIRESTTVLQTQVDGQDDIRAFATNLRDLSTAMRTSDQDLRTVLDTGAPTAATLRTVLSENADDIASLLSDAIRLNTVVRGRLDGIRGVLVIAPYGVESAFSIIAKDSRTGQYAARMSLSLQPENAPCETGYLPRSRQRTPFDRTPTAWQRAFACAEPQPRSAAAAKGGTSPAGVTRDESEVLGTYDVATGQVDVGGTTTIPDAPDLGKESWKWMLLGPAVAR